MKMKLGFDVEEEQGKAFLALKIPPKWKKGMNKKIIIAFAALEKAFDTVN